MQLPLLLSATQRYICQKGKMATGVEKAFCVLAFHETKSIVTVQRQFQGKYRKTPQSKPAIPAWYERFVTESCVCKHKSAGRPSVSTSTIEAICQTFAHSPKKICAACKWRTQSSGNNCLASSLEMPSSAPVLTADVAKIETHGQSEVA
ncbi:hypothetical protein J437_LFUL003418 [Ladona fulva]|uniref:DUF4817 domain-containing protein n=1 Tax=Ladona fulva TaxID=123851 RepID=A0A8K0NZ93_LADFU|nr:hypothetical protein J437_LFUL003418 [Ladona fulva]